MVIKIPTPNPTLKIPSITEQLIIEKEVISINRSNVNLFFIVKYSILIQQISPKLRFYLLYYFRK
jgi:hypothetical protein